MTLKLCGPKSDMRPSALNGIGLFRERVRAAQTRPFFVACLALPVFLCSLSGWVIIACNGCFFNTDSAVASLRGKRASSGSLLSDLSLIWNWSGLSVVADICAWADCSHTPFASPAPPRPLAIPHPLLSRSFLRHGPWPRCSRFVSALRLTTRCQGHRVNANLASQVPSISPHAQAT